MGTIAVFSERTQHSRVSELKNKLSANTSEQGLGWLCMRYVYKFEEKGNDEELGIAAYLPAALTGFAMTQIMASGQC